jgi:succinate-semialdehyde dehydrogenase / glutarate-semialdehyde dehydrogenase
VLADVPAAARCVREELFAPIAPIVRFSTEAEVLAAANSADVGLAAYF